MDRKPIIGITIGDMNGIGLEVILKTLANNEILKYCRPLIYGSAKIVSYHKNVVGLEQLNFYNTKDINRVSNDRVSVINCWDETAKITLGKETEEGGKYAYIALDRATKDLKDGKIDALVTAPINKKSMQLANFPYAGHTEFLTKELGGGESIMCMVHDDLRIGLASNHLPISKVSEYLTKKKVFEKIQVMDKTLRIDFGIERPIIAVMGLNPHAGDGGVIGDNEEAFIRPAVIEAKKQGVMAVGPFSADGFFGSNQYKKYDGVLAMYHDQGLIPFKLLAFGSGINYTGGIKGVRTSPDHGTAFDIAGNNEADPSSFRKALFLALDISKNRKEYHELSANALNSKVDVEKIEDKRENDIVE